MDRSFDHGPVAKCPVCGKYEVGLGYMLTCKENIRLGAKELYSPYRWSIDYVCTDCMERVKTLLTSTDG